jgi:hypothetical protein
MLSLSLRRIKSPFKSLSNGAHEALGAFPNLAGLRTVIWIAAGLLLVALVNLAQSSNAALIARNTSVKQARLAELQRQDALLRYEIAEATAPPNIERRAVALGLGPAKHVVYTSLPNLDVNMAEVMPAFEPHTSTDLVPPSTTNVPSPLDQVLALFGLGSSSDYAEAQSQ